MNLSRYYIIWLLHLLEFHGQLHHVPLRCSNAAGHPSWWHGYWERFVSDSSLGQCWTMLEDRAVIQRGLAGWSYKPTGLVLLSTEKCKVLHVGLNKTISAGWDWLSKQQLCRNGPCGLVDKLYMSHQGGAHMLGCSRKCFTSTWWEGTNPLLLSTQKAACDQFGSQGMGEVIKNWIKAWEGWGEDARGDTGGAGFVQAGEGGVKRDLIAWLHYLKSNTEDQDKLFSEEEGERTTETRHKL